ncbi:cation transporter [Candidatus Woesearchaeota archaeon]|nr:cation transporter [Candidatus Woesearchaeota archaeon]
MKAKDLRKIEKIVLVSAIVLTLIGIVEIFAGYFSKSIGLIADGIDSISDSVISFMVWFGLRISRKTPDNKFHFGYYRVETLVSMMVALAMIIMGIFIFYSAYLRLVNPVRIVYPLTAMIILLIGGLTSLWISIIKNRLAKSYKLLSVKADAKVSTKDWTSSLVILTGVFLSYMGFAWGDAIGALIVGVFIISVAITTIKQASLILIDGFNNPELVREILKIISKHPKVKLKDLRLRMSGPYIIGEISITVSSNMTVGKVFIIKTKIREEIMEKIGGKK